MGFSLPNNCFLTTHWIKLVSGLARNDGRSSDAGEYKVAFPPLEVGVADVDVLFYNENRKTIQFSPSPTPHQGGRYFRSFPPN